MKTILFLAALMLSTVSMAANYSGEPTENETAMANEQAGVLIAMGAIRSNCNNAVGELQYNVSVVSACFVDGFIRKVTFYKTPNCPPNQPCIQVIELVGTVTLDCNNNVISVECGISSI